jgi:hypothetical protein
MLHIRARCVCGLCVQTQEALDFCAAHGIAADIELISPKDINHAMVGSPGPACPARSRTRIHKGCHQ